MSGIADTLQAYETDFHNYLAHTRRPDSPQWYRWLDAVAETAPNPGVLEVGTGPGDHTAYLESRGLRIHRTDAAESVVGWLRSQGMAAERLDILTDDIKEKYGTVVSVAVFHHFTDDELRQALRNIRKALVPGGVLAFAQRRGTGSEWLSYKEMPPRFFVYREPAKVWRLTEECGFTAERMDCMSLGNSRLRESQWVCVIGRNEDSGRD